MNFKECILSNSTKRFYKNSFLLDQYKYHQKFYYQKLLSLPNLSCPNAIKFWVAFIENEHSTGSNFYFYSKVIPVQLFTVLTKDFQDLFWCIPILNRA